MNVQYQQELIDKQKELIEVQKKALEVRDEQIRNLKQLVDAITEQRDYLQFILDSLKSDLERIQEQLK